MKLFIKEHLSFVFLYLITFLGLPIVIEKLDGFGNHYGGRQSLEIHLPVIHLQN